MVHKRKTVQKQWTGSKNVSNNLTVQKHNEMTITLKIFQLIIPLKPVQFILKPSPSSSHYSSSSSETFHMLINKTRKNVKRVAWVRLLLLNTQIKISDITEKKKLFSFTCWKKFPHIEEKQSWEKFPFKQGRGGRISIREYFFELKLFPYALLNKLPNVKNWQQRESFSFFGGGCEKLFTYMLEHKLLS